jgi:Protein of unknown function (DUF2934)
MAERRTVSQNPTGRVLNLSDPRVFEAVKKRAYELYCKRGYTHGNDKKDWFEAEKQITRELGLMR